MKATGITRQVDEVGRIVLPIELRALMGIEKHDLVEIFTENDAVRADLYIREFEYLWDLSEEI